MEDQEREESPAEHKISEGLEDFANLLDPHLEARSEVKSRKLERLPWRYALPFIIGASVILWVLLLAVLYLIFR